jgi:DNA-binding transcriptional MocR family regulator
MSDTIWSPRVDSAAGPIYRAIADALERDLGRGVLREGQRLPTHRELAAALDVTPLTITRAYKEASRRGLIDSTVGRGTFIRGIVPPLDPAHAEPGLLDLSKNVVAATDPLELDSRAAATLRPVIRDVDYLPMAGSLRHRMACAAWMKRAGIDVSPDRVVITPGAQQGIVAILATLCRPGDTIAAEPLTYPRLGSIAALLHLKIETVELDGHGAVPRSLDAVLSKAKAFYCVPNLQNPTGSVLPERRRREIASMARRHNVPIIEDNVYGFLLDVPPPPIVSIAPDITCYVSSASKSLSPSLRLGFLALPVSLVDHVTETCGAMTAFTSSVAAEIFALLTEGGASDRCVTAKRELIVRNRHAAERALGERAVHGHAMSPHVWLPLPGSCDAHDLSARARLRGIAVAPAATFAVGQATVPNAIRISIGATSDTRALETALRTLAALIDEPRFGRGAVA